MADSNLVNLTENTTPQGTDVFYHVKDPSGTPLDRKVLLGNVNILPDGYMVNGKLSVTVSSNNITVALKTKSGGNPSATDPVSVFINGTFRACTAALSVTKNAGTNWFASGAAELATKEIDYFVYLIWNTTPGTDIMDIGFARKPSGRVYSDFSSTTTNENYLAFANASTPTSTDDVVNIGRFAATLSASASYNWSVPTFTNSNLINHPIYETRELTYVPAWAASGTPPALGDGTLVGKYQIKGIEILGESVLTCGGTTTYGTGVYTFTIPWTVSTHFPMACQALDSGTGYYTGVTYDFGANNLIYVVTSGNASTWGQTLPHTWASGDIANMRFGGRL